MSPFPALLNKLYKLWILVTAWEGR